MGKIKGQSACKGYTLEIRVSPESGEYHDGWHPNCSGSLYIFHAISHQDSLPQIYLVTQADRICNIDDDFDELSSSVDHHIYIDTFR